MRKFQILVLLWTLLAFASLSYGQTCGGTERWAVKDGTDSSASSIDLNNATPIDIPSLDSFPAPHLPTNNTTRVVPDETHVYRVRARLVKWKHETDSDYHLVLTDDTLRYTDDSAGIPPTGHSVIGEIPDLNCVSGAHATFGTSTPFHDSISSARDALDQQFPNADQSGAWNDAAGLPVEVTGVGFFDRPHGQTGRAPNNIEIHPILSISFNHGVPTPGPGPTPVPGPPPSPSGVQWEYQMIRAANASDLISQANALGAQGWELVSVVLDSSRPDKYVGYLKRKR